MATQHPSASELRAAFQYNPETGVICGRSGEPVGFRVSGGYRAVSFRGRQLLAHRVAWCLSTGQWPTHQIDHINGDKADNRLANLRDVTGLVNSQNMHRAKRNNRSGELGVSRYASGRYVARIFRNGQRLYLGSYSTASEARAAYEVAKKSPTGDLDGLHTQSVQNALSD